MNVHIYRRVHTTCAYMLLLGYLYILWSVHGCAAFLTWHMMTFVQYCIPWTFRIPIVMLIIHIHDSTTYSQYLAQYYESFLFPSLLSKIFPSVYISHTYFSRNFNSLFSLILLIIFIPNLLPHNLLLHSFVLMY